MYNSFCGNHKFVKFKSRFHLRQGPVTQDLLYFSVPIQNPLTWLFASMSRIHEGGPGNTNPDPDIKIRRVRSGLPYPNGQYSGHEFTSLKLALSFNFLFFFCNFYLFDNVSEMLYIFHDNKTTPFYLAPWFFFYLKMEFCNPYFTHFLICQMLEL